MNKLTAMQRLHILKEAEGMGPPKDLEKNCARIVKLLSKGYEFPDQMAIISQALRMGTPGELEKNYERVTNFLSA